MNDEFSRFHPLVNIVFYICVLGITMFQMQIGLIIISFIVAVDILHFFKKRMESKIFLWGNGGIFDFCSYKPSIFS